MKPRRNRARVRIVPLSLVRLISLPGVRTCVTGLRVLNNRTLVLGMVVCNELTSGTELFVLTLRVGPLQVLRTVVCVVVQVGLLALICIFRFMVLGAIDIETFYGVWARRRRIKVLCVVIVLRLGGICNDISVAVRGTIVPTVFRAGGVLRLAIPMIGPSNSCEVIAFRFIRGRLGLMFVSLWKLRLLNRVLLYLNFATLLTVALLLVLCNAVSRLTSVTSVLGVGLLNTFERIVFRRAW